MSEFKFTVIIPTHNSELGIKTPIESIINQTISFKNTIEIIIVDNASEDDTQKICMEYVKKYPQNIRYIQLSAKNFQLAKNIGLKESRGKYITFLRHNDYLAKNTLINVSKYINRNENVDVIVTPTYYFKNGRYERYLNYKVKKTQTVNLMKKPKFVQLLGISTIIKKESCEKFEFLNTQNQDITFFSEILINKPILGVVKQGGYYSTNFEEKIYPTDYEHFNLNKYNRFIKYNFDFLIAKSKHKYSHVPEFMKYNLINHIRWILYVKNIEKIDLSEFINNIKLIEDELYLDTVLLKNDFKIFTFLLKYKKNLSEYLKEKLLLNNVNIDTYDIIGNELIILASTINIISRNMEVYVNGEKINKKEIIFPQKDKFGLGYTYAYDNSIEVRIPLNLDKELEIEFKSKDKKLHIDFSRPCNFSKKVGYAHSRHYLSILKHDSIIVKRKTRFNWVKEEIKAISRMIKNHESGFEKAIPFRIAYVLGYPFLYNKRIWFYMDRPDDSDDNGLHLFKYANRHDDDIIKYYVLESKNREFKNIKKIGKVLGYKSIKHRYLGMFVENIITSHPDSEIVYPFWGGYPLFAGLLKSNIIFLQHGILKDDISSWLNRFTMNLSIFLVSSPQEYESIFRYPYNYDRNVIQILGLPRYDNLKNEDDKREIIIMPSWRRFLEHKSKEYVKESEFFNRFNSLINNERLIEAARKHNYRIIFRPHPKVYPFIDLFKQNDYVEIDYERVKYQTLFNNGSILITDYSSVAFDFAYLHKPVIYYQYGNDYHFDLSDSYYDYETMGFGEIKRSEEELVDLIIEYMENDCIIKEKYSKRIDNFFLFTDKNNCKRVEEAIQKMPLKD